MIVIRLNQAVRRRLGLAVAFFALLLLVRAGAELYGLAVPVSGDIQPLRSVAGREAAVALTFNVTWGRQVAEGVLEVLDSHGVKGVFFVSGPWAALHGDLVQRMRAEGHDVGISGNRQLDLTHLEVAELAAELEQAVASLAAVGRDDTGDRPALPVFFRPPGGAYDKRVLESAAGLGMTTVLWDVDARDWLQPGPEQITAQVLAAARAGSIILLHAGETHGQTLRALPAIIKGLREQELEPVPLSEMLGGAP